MPEQIFQQKIYPYDGQQDSTRNPVLISPSDIVDSDNIIYTTYSTKKLRPGISDAFESRPSGNRKILNAIDFWRLGEHRLVYYDGESIYSVDDNGVRDRISGAFVLPSDETISFVQFQGLLIIFLGGNTVGPFRWDMTGEMELLGANIPFAPFGRVFLNKLIIPDPDNSGRILHSETGDPTSFSGGDAGSIDLDVNDGLSDITAIFPPYYGSLYISKRFSIYKITPQYFDVDVLIYTQEKVSEGVGSNSHNGVCAVESSIIFPSDRGVHELILRDKIVTIQTQFLSATIQPKWRSDVNFARSQYMNSVYDLDTNCWLIAFPALGRNFNSDIWGLSIQAGKWFRWRDYNHSAICRYIDTDTDKLRTFVGSNDGDFGLIDSEIHSDYGDKYGATIESGIICPTSPDERFVFKHISPIFVPQDTGKFIVDFTVDGNLVNEFEIDQDLESHDLGGELAEDELGDLLLGGLPNVKLKKLSVDGIGSFYSFFIEYVPGQDSTIDDDFELLGILIDVDRVDKTTGELVG